MLTKEKHNITQHHSYPAQFEECISIAAVSKKDGLPVAPFSNSNLQVDYAGIGVDVISLKPFGGYQTMSGTSMACPHVCGFVAAIMSSNPLEVRKRLTEEYAIDIGLPGRDNNTGLGFVTSLDKGALEELFAKLGIKMKALTASAF